MKYFTITGLAIICSALTYGADTQNMADECLARAVRTFHVPARRVSVKYEGQRTDKTHAVNGSASVGEQERTFQCLLNASGTRILKFIANPAPKAAKTSSGASDEESKATERAKAGKFKATGQIPCAQHNGQPMGQCHFGVARAGGGSATIVVTLPGARKRTIFFSKGNAVGADTSQADGNPPFRVTKNADLFMISIGEERYEIPEAAVYGG